MVGNLEAPRITVLDYLDDDHGTNQAEIVPQPIMKIVYNGV
jgi:hypothetical protein